MKVFCLFLVGVVIHLSEQSFLWIDPSKPKEPIKTQLLTAEAAKGNRFIVNIVEYSYINNTMVKTPNKFRCIGTLVSENFVLTTANCVKTQIGTHIGVQFETMRDDTNEIGYSLTFDNTTVIIHDGYNEKDKEINNTALIRFNSLSVTTDPPLFQIFSPRKLGAIPKISNYCSVIGRNVHISNPPNDTIFVIGPYSCYGRYGTQAYCAILEDKNADVCKSLEGAPVVCKNNEISGFVLRESCVESDGRFQLRFHSVDTFKGWMDYWMSGQTTTPKPNSAGIANLTFGLLCAMLLGFILMI